MRKYVQVPMRGSTGNIAPSLSSPNKVKRDSGSTPDCEIEDEGDQRGPDTPAKQSSARKIVLVDPKDEKDENYFLKLGTEKFQALLHLESDELLKGSVIIRDIPAGSFLMREDAMQEAVLSYILLGSLVVSQHAPEGTGDVQLFTAYPGDLVGGLSVLSGDPSLFTVRAKHSTRIATITKETFYA